MNIFTKIALLTLFPVGLLNCVTLDQLLKCNPERTDQQELYNDALKEWKNTPEYKAWQEAKAHLDKVSCTDSWLPGESAFGPRTYNGFRHKCNQSDGQDSPACKEFERIKAAFEKHNKDAEEDCREKATLSHQSEEYRTLWKTNYAVQQELEKWEHHKITESDKAFKICKNTPEYKKKDDAKNHRIDVERTHTYVLPNRTWSETLSRTRTLDDFHNACCKDDYHPTKKCRNGSKQCTRFREMKDIHNKLVDQADAALKKADEDFKATKEYTEYNAQFNTKEGLKAFADAYLAAKKSDK